MAGRRGGFIAFVGRSSGDTLSREPGGDLIIPILVPAGPPDPSPSRTTWEVTTHGSNATLARLAGFEMPAGPLRIPSLYLPAAGSAGGVRFRIGFEHRVERAPGEYVITYTVVSGFAWSIAYWSP